MLLFLHLGVPHHLAGVLFLIHSWRNDRRGPVRAIQISVEDPLMGRLIAQDPFPRFARLFSVASPGFTRTNQPGVRDGSRGRDGTPTFDANRVAQKNGDWGSDVAGVEPNNDSIGSAFYPENSTKYRLANTAQPAMVDASSLVLNFIRSRRDVRLDRTSSDRACERCRSSQWLDSTGADLQIS